MNLERSFLDLNFKLLRKSINLIRLQISGVFIMEEIWYMVYYLKN